MHRSFKHTTGLPQDGKSPAGLQYGAARGIHCVAMFIPFSLHWWLGTLAFFYIPQLLKMTCPLVHLRLQLYWKYWRSNNYFAFFINTKSSFPHGMERVRVPVKLASHPCSENSSSVLPAGHLTLSLFLKRTVDKMRTCDGLETKTGPPQQAWQREDTSYKMDSMHEAWCTRSLPCSGFYLK